MEEMEELKETEICRRCHRKLKDDKSKELGFGPVCYKKYLKKKKSFLFDIEIKEEQ